MSLVPRVLLPIVPLLLLLPGHSEASGGRKGVHARPGEMVILREVPTRHAYRAKPPAMAIIVDPSPKREIAQTLGTAGGMQELGEDDYAAMGAGMASPSDAPVPTTVGQMTHQALGGGLGRVMGRDGVLGGDRISGSLGAPISTVGRTTAGIAGHISQALAQFPLGQAPAGKGNGP